MEEALEAVVADVRPVPTRYLRKDPQRAQAGDTVQANVERTSSSAVRIAPPRMRYQAPDELPLGIAGHHIHSRSSRALGAPWGTGRCLGFDGA